jgi:hypothetical protein
MRQQPLPLDPFNLTRIGMGTWMTNLIVARQFGQGAQQSLSLSPGVTQAQRGH